MKPLNDETLKRQLLDELIRGNSEPIPILQKLARSQYYRSIEDGRLFNEFAAGNLRELKVLDKAGLKKRFLCSWASFDTVTNRPYIYLMVFDNHLPSSLEGCDLLSAPWEREVCYSAVFMENIVQATAVDDANDVGGGALRDPYWVVDVVGGRVRRRPRGDGRGGTGGGRGL